MKNIYPTTMASPTGLKLLFTMAFFILFTPLAQSQCTRAFTYTVSPNLTVTFTPTTTDTNLSHFWFFHDHTSSTLRNPVKSYASFGPGTYAVNHAVMGNQCWDSATVFITISAPPCKPNFTYVVDSNKLGRFSMTSPTAADTSSIWFIVPGGIRYGTNPTYQFTQNGTYMVCLRKPNCSDTTCKLVTVPTPQPPPCNANYTYTLNSSTRGVSFVNSSNVGSQANHTWYFGDGNSSSLVNPSHTYAVDGTYNVCLVSAGTNCIDTVCKPVSVAAITPCNASFTFTQDSFGTVYFNNTSSPAQAYYSWNFGNGTSTQKNPIHQYNGAGAYVVCLTIRTYDSVCTSTICDTIVIGQPIDTNGCTASFTYSYDSIANAFHFYNTSPSTDTLITFLWSFGDGDSSSQWQNPTHQYSQQGVYYVCLYIRTRSGCAASYCDSVYFPGNDTTSTGCQANFTYTMYPDSISGANRIGVFQSQSTGRALNYTWLFMGSNQVVRTGPTQVYHFNEPNRTRYMVCLMITSAIDQCFDSSCAFIDILPDTINSGINEQRLLDNSSVYPVPVGNELWVDVAGTTDYHVTVLNTLGKQIYQTKHTAIAGSADNRMLINTSDWEQGVYLVVISNKHGSTIKRVIK